jgi:hypothetical protein
MLRALETDVAGIPDYSIAKGADGERPSPLRPDVAILADLGRFTCRCGLAGVKIAPRSVPFARRPLRWTLAFGLAQPYAQLLELGGGFC